MSRRSTSPRRRTARLLAFFAAGALALTACGHEDGPNVKTAEGFDAVTVSGDFGSEPSVEWKAKMEVSELKTEVLIEGSGPKLVDGDKVLANVVVGNGASETVVSSSYAKDGMPQPLTVGEKDNLKALVEALKNATIGTRVAVAAPPKDAFGETGYPQLGVGNADPVLFVVDLVSTLPSGPDGDEQKPASWAPKVVEKDGKPESFDFKGAKKPDEKLRVATLIEGTGDKTEKGQTVYVNYVGQVFDGEKPFDSSFAKGQPFPFTLGQGEVVKGWDKGLEGVPVGSRVIVAVPPKFGYGENGNEQAGIKGTDTLYFVVDLLAAV